MAATNAIIGIGTTFAIGDGATPTEGFDVLAEVVSIKPPSDSVDVIDASHLTSPNRTKEFITGLSDPGECELTIHFIPGGPDDTAIQALRGLTTRTNFQIAFPTSPVKKWTFAGLLVGYVPDVPINDRMVATVRIKVTGSYVVS